MDQMLEAVKFIREKKQKRFKFRTNFVWFFCCFLKLRGDVVVLLLLMYVSSEREFYYQIDQVLLLLKRID